MTDLAGKLAAVQQAYREGLLPLLGVRWRPGRSHEGNIWARTGAQADWKDDFPIASARTDELAAEVCAAHNALLDLLWLLGAGHDVQIGLHDHSGGPAVCVTLLGDSAGLAGFRDCGSLGEGLEKAREWSEREGLTP